MSGHLRVQSIAMDGARVLREASELLKTRFGIYLSTLQIEEESLVDEAGAHAIDVTRAGRH